MDQYEAELLAAQLAQDEAELERAAAFVAPGMPITEAAGDRYIEKAALCWGTRATVAGVRAEELRARYEKLLVYDEVKAALTGRARPTFAEINEAKKAADKASHLFEAERNEAVRLSAMLASREIQREAAEERRKVENAAKAKREAERRADVQRWEKEAATQYRRRLAHFAYQQRGGGNL